MRSPQAAIYGKDSIGGVINVVSKTPENEWSGNVGAEYGNYNWLNLSADANGALIDDKLFLSLGGAFSNDDGWIKNEFNNDDKAAKEKKYKINATLTAKPTERLTARLTLAQDIGDEYFYKGGNGVVGVIKRKDAKHVNFDMPTKSEDRSFSQALGIDYEFDNAKFSSVTTHRKSKSDYDGDMDFTANPATFGLKMWQSVHIDTLTQELRLSSLNSDRLKWIGGLYFEHEKTENKKMGQDFSMGPGMSNSQDAPAKATSDTAAIFGQFDYEFIDDFIATLGGRYRRIKKDIDMKMIYQAQVPSYGMVDYAMSDKATWNKFLPKVGLTYRINDDFSAFASYSQGYLAGGYNYFATMKHPKNKFEPQLSHNYEIGLHGSAFDNTLNFGATIFHMDIKDIHTYDIVPPNVYLTSNGGRATSDGIELDGTLQATKELEIRGAIGINKTKYKENMQFLDRATGEQLAKGKKIEYSPTYSANLGFTYSHHSGFYALADLYAIGERYFDATNKQKQKASLSVDTRVGYRFKDFDVYAYANNLTNEEYVTSFMSHGGGAGMVHFNDPRRFGVGVKCSF